MALCGVWLVRLRTSARDFFLLGSYAWGPHATRNTYIGSKILNAPNANRREYLARALNSLTLELCPGFVLVLPTTARNSLAVNRFQVLLRTSASVRGGRAGGRPGVVRFYLVQSNRPCPAVPHFWYLCRCAV
jgi:hypothetical protein